MIDRKSEYVQKLKDPRWQKKRLQIFERDEWACQICFDTKSTLIVHHRLYLPNTEPWDYPNELLVTLCESCHEQEGTQFQPVANMLIDHLRKKFFSNDLIDLALGFYKMDLLHNSEVVASSYSFALSSPKIQRFLIDKYLESIKHRAKTNKE
jgi:hypothetical protein